MKRIGITSTVPQEVLLAAAYQPVDLNNIFISSPDPARFVRSAERAGFPANICTWIKGIYGVCAEGEVDTLLGVTTGDCANTGMLMEVLADNGITTIPFAYPEQMDAARMQQQLVALAERLGTSLPEAEAVRSKLSRGRGLARELDEMTWRDNLVSGAENHYWLVSASDFNQDYPAYCRQLGDFIETCRWRPAYPADEIRLAYLGVPPVFPADLYRFLEKQGARVVFNEVQRQFAMIPEAASLAAQYTAYTYPYSLRGRLDDIKTEIERRQVDGVIHYVQAFCHRGIGDIVLRRKLKPPVLTMEGNDGYSLNTHQQTRIEAFLEMLRRRNAAVKTHQYQNAQPH